MHSSHTGIGVLNRGIESQRLSLCYTVENRNTGILAQLFSVNEVESDIVFEAAETKFKL